MDGAGNIYIGTNRRVRKVDATGTIDAVAGNEELRFSGDGRLATDANLAFPADVAVDATGNLYISDAGNERVRKVSVDGIIATVAGSGVNEFSGDGGPAASASLARPTGVAVDAAGNLYISDSGNRRVRKVSVDGIISTVAGNGVAGFSGDGGPATSASLFGASAVAVDAVGNLYIADGNRIRKVSPVGIIATVAGNGLRGFSGDGGPAISAQLNSPRGVTVDAAGNLYIADTVNNRIRKVSADGTITTVAGNGVKGFSGDGGLATDANLNFPPGVAVDGGGNLYIADTQNRRIRKVSLAARV